MVYTEEECMNALKKADQRTNGILSSSKYSQIELDVKKPSVSTIHNKFGAWNKAKEEAGIETITEEESWKNNDNPTNYLDIPSEAEFTEEEWKNLTKPQRYYYRNREKIIEKAETYKNKTIQENKEWVRNYKKTLECENCGEKRHKCLQFHHRDTDDKTKSVSQMINNGVSLERIIQEIRKCDVLCANCHTIHHIENGYK